MRHRLFAPSLWVATLVSLASPVLGDNPDHPQEKPKESAKFVRLRRDEAGKELRALETSIVRFRDPARPELVVDLVGAVHIADRPYYQDLNKRFDSYDAVLYELVAPEGTRIPKGQKAASAHPVGVLQIFMKNQLELSFQLEEVDYTKKNLVHADMSPEEFSKSMKDRGESFFQIMLRAIGQGIAQQSRNPERTSDSALLLALFSKDRMQLKRLVAEQFEDMDAQMLALSGPDGSTLITERNKKALEVLQREINDGKKRLAIFYGAGHLADMEQRLVKDFGLKRAEETWLSAWSLK